MVSLVKGLALVSWGGLGLTGVVGLLRGWAVVKMSSQGPSC